LETDVLVVGAGPVGVDDFDTRVLPAMMSFRTLLMSALVRSFTRRAPSSGMMCRSMRPLSVTTIVGFLGRPPFPRMRPAFRSFRQDPSRFSVG